MSDFTDIKIVNVYYLFSEVNTASLQRICQSFSLKRVFFDFDEPTGRHLRWFDKKNGAFREVEPEGASGNISVVVRKQQKTAGERAAFRWNGGSPRGADGPKAGDI